MDTRYTGPRRFHIRDICGKFITLVYTRDKLGNEAWALPGGTFAYTENRARFVCNQLDALVAGVAR